MGRGKHDLGHCRSRRRWWLRTGSSNAERNVYLNANRFLALGLGIGLGIVHGWAAVGCEDVAILARDGRYIVASADDLAEKGCGKPVVARY